MVDIVRLTIYNGYNIMDNVITHNTTQEKNMSNKTPYELRFEVLQMARELVQQKYDLQNNAIELQICTDIDRGASVSK